MLLVARLLRRITRWRHITAWVTNRNIVFVSWRWVAMKWTLGTHLRTQRSMPGCPRSTFASIVSNTWRRLWSVDDMPFVSISVFHLLSHYCFSLMPDMLIRLEVKSCCCHGRAASACKLTIVLKKAVIMQLICWCSVHSAFVVCRPNVYGDIRQEMRFTGKATSLSLRLMAKRTRSQ